jgi:predicted short-subunit dehydrogenase-like oxidoreductase (DUF2520 family)
MGLSLASILVEAQLADELLLVGPGPEAPQHSILSASATRYADRLSSPPPAGTTVLLAVPDSSIAAVAGRIASLGQPGLGCVALHLSGAQSANVLEPLAERGYATGSLHPLQTVADPQQGAERLRGAFFTFEGDAGAREAALAITGAGGGTMLEVRPEDKARYHAACVFASNYVVTSAAVAVRLLAEAVGISRAEAATALQPLWSGAVANLAQLGLPRALTGPIARGDLETVRGHLASLENDIRDLYSELALQTLELSRESGLDEETASMIEAEIRSSGLRGEVRR